MKTLAELAAGGYRVCGATKAALRSFACSWTVELKHRKIRVNAISPGPIDTPGLRGFIRGLGQSDEQIRTSIVTTVPQGMMDNPDEVAKAVLFLATDDSSFVSGIELFVDGGDTNLKSGTNLNEQPSLNYSAMIGCT